MLSIKILDIFLQSLEGKKVLEIGLDSTLIRKHLNNLFITSLDVSKTRFRKDASSNIKTDSFVRLPYDGGFFDGIVCYKSLDLLGDVGYFVSELLRITKGKVLIIEQTKETYPIEYFETLDDVIIDYSSIDNHINKIGKTPSELISKGIFKDLFYSPESSLRFNLLVPEERKTEAAIILSKI